MLALALNCLIVVFLLYFPGIVLASALRLSRFAWALAPGLSLGFWTFSACVLGFFPSAWNRFTTTALVIILVFAVFWFRGKPDFAFIFRNNFFWVVLSLFSSLLVIFPFLTGWGGVDNPAQTWDGLFHQGAIGVLRDASSSAASSLWDFTNATTFYPYLFHLLGALLPGDIATSYTALMLTLAALFPGALSAAVYQLVKPFTSYAKSATCIVSFVVALNFNSPFALATIIAVGPYLLSLLALPSLLLMVKNFCEVIVAKDYRNGVKKWLPAVLISLLGLFLAHPTALVNLLVLTWPLVLYSGINFFLALKNWAVRAGFLVSVLFVFSSLLFLAGPALISMSSYYRHAGGVSTRIEQLFFGSSLVTGADGGFLIDLVFALFSLLGVVFSLLKRRLYWVTLVLPGTVLVFLAHSFGGFWSLLSAPWYHQAIRIYPLVQITQAILAVFAIGICTAWLNKFLGGTKILGHKSGLGKYLILMLLIGLAASFLAFKYQGLTQIAEQTYRPESIRYGTMLSKSEKVFQQQVAKVVKPGEGVLADPSSGAPYLYIKYGVKIYYPHLSKMFHSDKAYLWKHLANSEDKKVCQILKAQNLRYFYIDEDREAGNKKYGARIITEAMKPRLMMPGNKILEFSQALVSKDGKQKLIPLNLEACKSF